MKNPHRTRAVVTAGTASWSWCDILCLSLLVAATFASALPGGFVWIDHRELVQGDYRADNFAEIRALLTQPLDSYVMRRSETPAPRGGYWRPLYALSISLDWMLWNGRAWLYHLENIVWHLAVVAGLYLLGCRLSVPGVETRRAAFWAAALFAVHPFAVHSVTWISGRKDTMTAALAIGSLLAMLRTHLAGSLAGQVTWAGVSLLALAAACMSKELALVTPLVGCAYLVCDARGAAGATRSEGAWATGGAVHGRSRWPGPRVLTVAAQVVVVAGFVAWRHFVLGGVGLGGTYRGTSLLSNLATSATVWWYYVLRVFWPWPVQLSDSWPIASGTSVIGIVAWLGLVAALVVPILAVTRKWFAAFGLLWYAVWMLPASGLTPLNHWYAERYLYPASWGLLLVVVQLWLIVAPAAGRSLIQDRLQWLVPAAATLTLACTTAWENQFWHSDQALFERAVAIDPNYAEGHLGLADVALGDRQYDRAAQLAEHAIALHSDPARASFLSLPTAHRIAGRAWSHRAREELKRGQALQAEQVLRDALTKHPDHYECQSTLAVVLIARSGLEGSTKLMPECRQLLQGLVQRNPTDEVNRRNLAAAYLAIRNYADAEPHLAWIAGRQPDDAVTIAKWAWCLWHLGRREEAVRHWERAQQLAPSDPTVRAVGVQMRRDHSLP